ncbi:MAG: acyltransferase [Novosphingobium sp.]|nr:acyltransferase [Novosphingobium sp.]
MVGHNRYRLLDEMRGIAALAVLVFHIGTRGGGPLIVPNGFLAVDFFFMLSGFVIAEAYEARLARGLSFADFALRRLVRMAPVAMLGALAGGAYLAARAFAAPLRSDPLRDVIGANLLNLMILPKLWHGRATGWEMYPANGPLWSLFFEIAVNLVWAAFLAGRGTRLLGGLVIASAGLLVDGCGRWPAGSIAARRPSSIDNRST